MSSFVYPMIAAQLGHSISHSVGAALIILTVVSLSVEGTCWHVQYAPTRAAYNPRHVSSRHGVVSCLNILCRVAKHCLTRWAAGSPLYGFSLDDSHVSPQFSLSRGSVLLIGVLNLVSSWTVCGQCVRSNLCRLLEFSNVASDCEILSWV